MDEVLHRREDVVRRIPEIVLEDNSKRLVDDIEQMWVQFQSPLLPRTGEMGTAVAPKKELR